MQKQARKLNPQLKHFESEPSNEAELRDLVLYLWKDIFPEMVYINGYSDKSPDILAKDNLGNQLKIEFKHNYSKARAAKNIKAADKIVIWENNTKNEIPNSAKYIVIKDKLRSLKLGGKLAIQEENIEKFINELGATYDTQLVIKRLLSNTSTKEFIASDIVIKGKNYKSRGTGKILSRIISLLKEHKLDPFLVKGPRSHRANRRGTLWKYHPEKVPQKLLAIAENSW